MKNKDYLQKENLEPIYTKSEYTNKCDFCTSPEEGCYEMKIYFDNKPPVVKNYKCGKCIIEESFSIDEIFKTKYKNIID
jgi:hypothetical protein